MANSSKSKGLELDASKWTKPKVKKLQLLKGITKSLLGIQEMQMSGSVSSVVNGAFDIFESVKLEKSAGQLGWILIANSLIRALTSLICEQKIYRLEPDEIVIEGLEKQMNKLLEDEKQYLGSDFFLHPERLPLLQSVKPVFNKFLMCFSFKDYERKNMLSRLDSYFTLSLVTEWRSNYERYAEIKEALNTPFDPAEEKEYEWLKYREYLINQTAMPVLGESFGLADIYIPLNAYYTEKPKTKTKKEEKEPVEWNDRQENDKKVVLELDSYLSEWIAKKDRNDTVKVICGGPGYGKSSTLKMIAARLAKNNEKVLFIPLHHFDLQNKLWESITDYFRDADFFRKTALRDEDNIILIFDGLDELVMSGKQQSETAIQLVEDVKELANVMNTQRCRTKIILSGRNVIVDEIRQKLKEKGQILHLLPYFLNEKEIEKGNFKDAGKLLEKDLRNDWWEKYGKLKSKRYKKLPAKLKIADLQEITALPLLNMLVALSYEGGTVTFSSKTNLNDIYYDLICKVHQREYASEGTLKTFAEISNQDFIRLLQEIAVTSWQTNNSRTVSVKEIEKRLAASRLNQKFSNFLKDAEKGVISLLAGFYFQQSDRNSSGDRTFEFSHKSFGEYLVATYIVEQIKIWFRQIASNEEDYNLGMTVKDVMEKWIVLFGPKPLTQEISKFITNEIAKQKKETQELFQKYLVCLIDDELANGLPIESNRDVTTYPEMKRHALNVESSLFILHGITANFTDTVSTIKWSSENDFKNLITRFSEEVDYISNNIISYHLNHLDLRFQYMHFNYLYSANLTKCILIESAIENTNLLRAKLTEINLQKSHIDELTLRASNLFKADLSGSKIYNSDFNYTNLIHTDFSNSKLIFCDLRYAKVNGANFTGARLTGIRVSRSMLPHMNLTEEQLEHVIIEDD